MIRIGRWQNDVIQCTPVDEIVPTGEAAKISGVIMKLNELSSYFIPKECHIKRDESALVGT